MSAGDFSWLDRRNYMPLETGDLHLWSTVILDRVELNRFLNAGEQQFVVEQFEKLKAAPLKPLGFGISARNTHPASQGSVKVLTAGNHFALTDSLSLTCDGTAGALRDRTENKSVIDYSSSVDEAVQQHDHAWCRYAHLQIDLHATDKVLEEDFGRWLKAWKAQVPIQKPLKNLLQQKAASWGARGVVPYFDMQMLARLRDKQIPRPVVTARLTRRVQTSRGEQREAPSRSALDELRGDLPRIFNSATVHTFLNALSVRG
ncbi:MULTISPECIES: DUF6387 family protein [Paraburkholderia]|uniref:DUF6387 family protein n=1 Tax=Paraburkholderia TaxID=1822464 RepID=UPI002251B73E|nr:MULTISPECIES: DUF6387 family protein [Paraburkholderia]MCX4156643.1 DUF6387 family protein [Paraburkholderia aspalathi]MDN7166048.1 DUF6387 family protein [Paraburkholderia sp. SECH2]MDQ6394534.1 DUF6387 family protein [Paraburkholderia aspalathi]